LAPLAISDFGEERDPQPVGRIDGALSNAFFSGGVSNDVEVKSTNPLESKSGKVPVVNVELAPIKKENVAPLDVPGPSQAFKNDEPEEKMDEFLPKKEITVLMNELSLLLPFSSGMTIADLKYELATRQNISADFDIFRGGIRLSETISLEDHAEVLQLVLRNDEQYNREAREKMQGQMRNTMHRK